MMPLALKSIDQRVITPVRGPQRKSMPSLIAANLISAKWSLGTVYWMRRTAFCQTESLCLLRMASGNGLARRMKYDGLAKAAEVDGDADGEGGTAGIAFGEVD